jgi:hypothetical protein
MCRVDVVTLMIGALSMQSKNDEATIMTMNSCFVEVAGGTGGVRQAEPTTTDGMMANGCMVMDLEVQTDV